MSCWNSIHFFYKEKKKKKREHFYTSLIFILYKENWTVDFTGFDLKQYNSHCLSLSLFYHNRSINAFFKHLIKSYSNLTTSSLKLLSKHMHAHWKPYLMLTIFCVGVCVCAQQPLYITNVNQAKLVSQVSNFVLFNINFNEVYFTTNIVCFVTFESKQIIW